MFLLNILKMLVLGSWKKKRLNEIFRHQEKTGEKKKLRGFLKIYIVELLLILSVQLSYYVEIAY